MESIPRSLLDSSPDLDELLKVVSLTAEWYDIGGRLGVDSNKLNEIYFSQHSGEYKLSRMYQLWLDSKAEKATRRQLLEVLENKELKRQASDYIKYLQQSTENSKLYIFHKKRAVHKQEFAFYHIINVCMVCHFQCAS